jgi:hypothetical protein
MRFIKSVLPDSEFLVFSVPVYQKKPKLETNIIVPLFYTGWTAWQAH